jgi:hypothetical protein
MRRRALGRFSRLDDFEVRRLLSQSKLPPGAEVSIQTRRTDVHLRQAG